MGLFCAKSGWLKINVGTNLGPQIYMYLSALENLWGETWEEDLLIWAMFASTWQMAAKCVKKYDWPIMKMRLCYHSLIICLASILHITYLHHNFTVWHDTCFVQKDYFSLNYWNAWGNYWRSLEGIFCIINIGENTPSVTYSDIYHVLSDLFP